GGVAVRKARKGVTMQATEGHPVHRTGTQRIEALGDGVFAIVMTLLIFDLKLPEVEAPAALGPALLALWPSFLAFAISFGLLGIYWLGHRAQFQFIQYSDHGLHWLNILILACVSLLPFSTKLLGRYPSERVALAGYGANLIVIGLSLYAH